MIRAAHKDSNRVAQGTVLPGVGTAAEAGLEMVVDGTPREKLDETLQTELQFIQERHATGKKVFDFLGASLPAFGMVGTLIFVAMLVGVIIIVGALTFIPALALGPFVEQLLAKS